MAHRRVGDELLEIRLHERDECAVHDSDDGKRQDHTANRGVHGRAGEQRQRVSQEPKGSHLQHDGGKNHRSGRWRFDVRIREPCMEREHGDFHRERDRERNEEPDLRRRAERGVVQDLVVGEAGMSREIRRLRAEVDDADEHQHRSGHRIQEEFETGVEPALPAPHPDDQVHRHQHQFPHHEEQHEVERHEDAEHAGREHHEQRVVAVDLLADARPPAQHGERHQERGEQHQRHRDAVHAERESHPPRGDPRQ